MWEARPGLKVVCIRRVGDGSTRMIGSGPIGAQPVEGGVYTIAYVIDLSKGLEISGVYVEIEGIALLLEEFPPDRAYSNGLFKPVEPVGMEGLRALLKPRPVAPAPREVEPA